MTTTDSDELVRLAEYASDLDAQVDARRVFDIERIGIVGAQRERPFGFRDRLI